MLSQQDFQLNELHLNDMQRAAEQARLVRQAQQNQPKSKNVVNAVLAGLGKQMVQVGQHLQEQFDAPVSLKEA
jgi:hypothetical protein